MGVFWSGSEEVEHRTNWKQARYEGTETVPSVRNTCFEWETNKQETWRNPSFCCWNKQTTNQKKSKTNSFFEKIKKESVVFHESSWESFLFFLPETIEKTHWIFPTKLYFCSGFSMKFSDRKLKNLFSFKLFSCWIYFAINWPEVEKNPSFFLFTFQAKQSLNREKNPRNCWLENRIITGEKTAESFWKFQS